MNAPHPTVSIEDRGVLRFITAGSVDDGKSTLIGRLLYDTRSILTDQLAALARAGERRPAAKAVATPVDLSLLTDGLEAEREQGITIDVAYRYFATARRKFIIADTPGHEQYTRNMVTGASTADAAVILVDATRVVDGQLLPQTRRHTALAQMLGIRHIVVAVNKLDQHDFSQALFDSIVAAYRRLAAPLGLTEFTAIPVSALLGDNIASRSEHTPWYHGPTLLEWLEQVPSRLDDDASSALPLRFAVQLVLRETNKADPAAPARWYAGRIGSGALRVGDSLRVLPSGQTAVVRALRHFDTALEAAGAGEAVTVQLDRELDISRGDWLVPALAQAPTTARCVAASLAWLDAEPLVPQRKLWLRHGTRWLQARVRSVERLLDLASMGWQPAQRALGANDIAQVVIETQQPLVFDPYEINRHSGAFVLVDATSHHTVAAGMLRAAAPALEAVA